ncbi:hypothetical protein SBRY_60452 [Actinacidiphila bryophytorum]|uniref:Uncharacterized protein n=1 Tax=Actinacidiphila bryophytorum TaxID=1436133 RepID=A0A9W4H6G6_9ACTN|nr:hypothetical protein SBRY_60452 [Actinacidiphila bryophytorum]
MVGLAVRVPARGRLQVQPRHRAPADRQHDLARQGARRVRLGVRHHPADHDRRDPADLDRLRRGRRVRRRRRVVRGLLVGVAHDEAALGEHQHGDVPPHLVRVERRLLVHQIRRDRLLPDRRLHGLRHERRIIATALDRRPQPLRRGPGLRHAPILVATAPLPLYARSQPPGAGPPHGATTRGAGNCAPSRDGGSGEEPTAGGTHPGARGCT